MSLKVQIERLYILSKHQKQRSKEENICDILFQCFEEKALTLFFSNPTSFSYIVHFK
jgi:hypothetical protein